MVLATMLGAACTGAPAAIVIDKIEPPYAPLAGGTLVTIRGAGLAAGPGGAQVLVGGRPAPLVDTIDDATLAVLVPPGERAGAAEVVIVIGDRAGRAADAFRYSAPPTIDAAAPADVLAEAAGTRVTVTGSGFLAEEAGPPILAIDGIGVVATVESDRELSFLAPAGRALWEPELELVNRRGRAVRDRAYRYIPARAPGLLLFDGTTLFATYVDPVRPWVVEIPRVTTGIGRLTAVVRDGSGGAWGFDRNRRLGRLDLGRQRLEAPVFLGRWVPAMTRVGADVIAIDRASNRLGRLDLASGAFTPLGDQPVPCCGSFGLASDGVQIWLTARTAGGPALYTVAPATGALGEPLPLAEPTVHVEDLRWFAGALYAVTRDRRLVTIDPATGAIADVLTTANRVHAIDVFE
jgi:hypothetical protein